MFLPIRVLADRTLVCPVTPVVPVVPVRMAIALPPLVVQVVDGAGPAPRSERWAGREQAVRCRTRLPARRGDQGSRPPGQKNAASHVPPGPLTGLPAVT